MYVSTGLGQIESAVFLQPGQSCPAGSVPLTGSAGTVCGPSAATVNASSTGMLGFTASQLMIGVAVLAVIGIWAANR